MDVINTTLNNIALAIQLYAPSILGAIVLIIVAWLVAAILRAIVVRVGTALHLDERYGRDVGDPNKVTPISRTIGNVVFWITILLFLPAILGALNLTGILFPFQNMINTLLAFIPNLIAAALILGAGWLVASIVRRVLVTVFGAIGVDRLADRVGISQALGAQRLSYILATIVFLLILIPVLIAALDALQLDAITAPASAMLNSILLALPNIFAAFLLLAIAYVVGRIIASLVSNVLTALGFNRLMGALGLGRAQAVVDEAAMTAQRRTQTVPVARAASVEDVARGWAAKTPSEIAGYLVLVAVMLFAGVEALRLVGFVALAELGVLFVNLLGQIVLGLIVFAVGLWLANLAATVIEETGSRWSYLLAPAARVAILVLAGAMALRQMGIANEIVNLAFGLMVGAIAVAVALAFGLGGRDVAGEMLHNWQSRLEEESSAGKTEPRTYPPQLSGRPVPGSE